MYTPLLRIFSLEISPKNTSDNGRFKLFDCFLVIAMVNFTAASGLNFKVYDLSRTGALLVISF